MGGNQVLDDFVESPIAPSQGHVKLGSPDWAADPVVPNKPSLDPTERDNREAEIRSINDTLTRLEAELTQDRRAARAATAQLAALSSESMQRGDQVDSLRVQVEILEERLTAEHQRLDEVAGEQDKPARFIGALSDGETHQGVIDHLIEEQARMSEVLSALSRDVVAERLRTTTIIFAGIATATVALAVWFFVGAPTF